MKNAVVYQGRFRIWMLKIWTLVILTNIFSWTIIVHRQLLLNRTCKKSVVEKKSWNWRKKSWNSPPLTIIIRPDAALPMSTVIMSTSTSTLLLLSTEVPEQRRHVPAYPIHDRTIKFPWCDPFDHCSAVPIFPTVPMSVCAHFSSLLAAIFLLQVDLFFIVLWNSFCHFCIFGTQNNAI